ncbi:MAG TPA: MFS transporter [Ardenticatenaceae bacterium]|nr:MFS transporter [Ardenticatenaceae bacterium]
MPFLLRHRNFALLWFAGLISMIGDWMLIIALPVYVYETTGSTLATGIMFMVGRLPSLLLGSVAGVFVDRWDHRRTMIVVNLLLAASLLPLVLVPGTGWLWIVYVVAFVESSVGQFFGPAENALLPTLVGKEHLVTANSLNALNNNLARLLGPALGGFVALRLGLGGVVILDVGTFLLAALLIGLIRLAPATARFVTPEQAATIEAPAGIMRFLHEWRAGLRLVRREPLVSLLFTMTALMAIGEGVLAVLFVPFVTEVLRAEALELGWLMSAQAVGGLLGGAIIARLGNRLSPAHILGPSAVIFGLIDLAIFNYPALFPGITIALALFILVGLPAAALGASFSTLLQNSVDESYLGRIFGAHNTTFALLTLIGMALASLLGDLLGIVPVINIQGVAPVVAGLLAMRLLPRIQRRNNETLLSSEPS